MYKSLEAIEKLREKKIKELKSVYSVMDISTVYEKQVILNSMSINIFTDTASAIMETVEADGVGRRVVPRISARLDKLKFTSVPDEDVIDEAYNKSMSDLQNYQPVTKTNTKLENGKVLKIRGKSLPLFLLALVAQGVVVPLLINKSPVLVKVIVLSANGLLMTVEVVKYYQYQKSKAAPTKNTSGQTQKNDMKRQAVCQAYKDNLNELNRWFDNFAEITKEEIEEELAKKEV